MYQGLSECLLYGSLGSSAYYSGTALVTLAVIIGTYVKQGVLVVVIPLYDAAEYMVIRYGCAGIGLMEWRAQLRQHPAA